MIKIRHNLPLLALCAAVAIGGIVAMCAPVFAASAASAHRKPCATFDVGFRDHGMEVDAPVKICGTGMHRATWTCKITKGQFGEPGERWACEVSR